VTPPAGQAPASPTPPAATPPAATTAAAAPVAAASDGDPAGGKFTLAEATAGLTGKGDLIADIKTSKGALECKLYDDKAPNTVANFIGLARALRPWKNPSGAWVKSAAYDGTTFHRIIKGFMIQGGDPQGTGGGEPGYVIPDEVWPGAKHDQRGLLCMANRGPNTNGMQFFITDGAPAHLDGGYTIFGKCGPDSVVETLASVPVMGERPADPPKIEKVTIRRGKAK
jgi:peptidyl-prolyl cis-trans isomerase A (cyclophilin A)